MIPETQNFFYGCGIVISVSWLVAGWGDWGTVDSKRKWIGTWEDGDQTNGCHFQAGGWGLQQLYFPWFVLFGNVFLRAVGFGDSSCLDFFLRWWSSLTHMRENWGWWRIDHVVSFMLGWIDGGY
jgi:hypothetical protein